MERVISQWARDFTASGSPSYKKRQVARLRAILMFCFENYPELDYRVNAIGRKHLVAYWKATEGEADKVRLEKYRVLKHFFGSGFVSRPPVVPKPLLRDTVTE